MSEPGFWDSPDGAREVIAEAKTLKGWVEPWDALTERATHLGELGELLEADEDEALEAEWRTPRRISRISRTLSALRVASRTSVTLRGPSAGAGTARACRRDRGR